jgi:hypothetical protein
VTGRVGVPPEKENKTENVRGIPGRTWVRGPRAVLPRSLRCATRRAEDARRKGRVATVGMTVWEMIARERDGNYLPTTRSEAGT